jgi:hypothetical protein
VDQTATGPAGVVADGGARRDLQSPQRRYSTGYGAGRRVRSIRSQTALPDLMPPAGVAPPVLAGLTAPTPPRRTARPRPADARSGPARGRRLSMSMR